MKTIWKIPFSLFLWNILIYLNYAKVTNSDQLKTNLRNGFGQNGNLTGHVGGGGHPNLKKQHEGGFFVQGNDDEKVASREAGEPEETEETKKAAATPEGSVALVAPGKPAEEVAGRTEATGTAEKALETGEQKEKEKESATSEEQAAEKVPGEPAAGTPQTTGTEGTLPTAVTTVAEGTTEAEGTKAAAAETEKKSETPEKTAALAVPATGPEEAAGREGATEAAETTGKEVTTAATTCPGNTEGCKVGAECTHAAVQSTCTKAEGGQCTTENCDVCKKTTTSPAQVSEQVPTEALQTTVVSPPTGGVNCGQTTDPNSLQAINLSDKDKDISSKEEEVLMEREVENDVEKEDAHEDDTGEEGETDSANYDDVDVEEDDEEVEDEIEDPEYAQQITETQNAQKMPTTQNNTSDVGYKSVISEATIHSAFAEEYKDTMKGKKEAEAFVNTLLDLLDGDNSEVDDAIKHLADDISQFVLK